MILHKDGSSAVGLVFNIALEKGREEKGKKIISTRGIRIWSPIQVLAPLNRA